MIRQTVDLDRIGLEHNGDVVRFHLTTEKFRSVKPDGTIRTYYKPDPAMHGRPTHLDYFNAQ